MKNAMLVLVCVFVFICSAFSQTTVSGNVSGVWDSWHSPYYVTGDLHIPTDSTLRIMPGVEVIFQGHYALWVDSMATLKAIGTIDDSILFTPIDTVLTDSTGGWHGIRFTYSADGCTLSYCRIEYGNAIDTIDFVSVERNGGGIYCFNSPVVIMNNTICNNKAENNGGGIYCDFSSTIIQHNRIINNKMHGWCSGGIYIGSNSPIINGNIISYNDGGIALIGSTGIVMNNIVSYNESSAIHCRGGKPTYINNVIRNNTYAGVYCDFTPAILINNLISENEVGIMGRVLNLIIINCIIINNRSTVDIAHFFMYNNSYYIAYTNLDSLRCEFKPDDIIIWGPGNINSDPLFSDSLFHLSEHSPCINAGAESIYVPYPWDTTIYAPTTDIEGNPRPIGAGVDIGAYEYNPTYIAENNNPKLPQTFSLSAYPNPFNLSIKIELVGVRLSDPIHNGRGYLAPTIEIYNINGQCVWSNDVRAIHELPLQNDGYTFVWQPDNNIPTGIYFVRALIENKSITKKILYLK